MGGVRKAKGWPQMLVLPRFWSRSRYSIAMASSLRITDPMAIKKENMAVDESIVLASVSTYPRDPGPFLQEHVEDALEASKDKVNPYPKGNRLLLDFTS